MPVRIINPQAFDEAASRFPHKAKAINRLRLTLEAATPKNSAELHRLLPTMKRYGGGMHSYRFDVGGRKGLRMIAAVRFGMITVRVYMIGTHKEYDAFKLDS